MSNTSKKTSKIDLATLNSAPLRSVTGLAMAPIRIKNAIATGKR